MDASSRIRASCIMRRQYDGEDQRQVKKFLSEFNSSFEIESSKISRIMNKPSSYFKRSIAIPPMHTAESYFDNFLMKEKNRRVMTPVPPKLRNRHELANAKMVKYFLQRYQSLWILISAADHPAREIFTSIYQEEKKENKYNILENMLVTSKWQRFKIFTNEGMDVKLLVDYASYEKMKYSDIQDIEKNEKVLEAYFEENLKTKDQAIDRPTKKIKNQQSLVIFLENDVKEEISKCRKDIPYPNFIHFDSGPELFNRRTIIQDCLYPKSQDELRENHENFVKLLHKFTQNDYERRMHSLKAENLKDYESEPKMQKIRQEIERLDEINKDFYETMKKYLIQHHPIENEPDEIKKEVYNWIISRYTIQSAIYPVVNNTIRFSFNIEKFRPISTYTRYLYEAIRYYFTTRHRELTYQKVYRGSRVSFQEQSSLRPGKYLWNLGFMSTSISEKVAKDFLMQSQGDEQVLITIQFSKFTNTFDYLWNQEGFYLLDRINEIKDFLPGDEQEVLFNPLNIFQVKSWDMNKRQLNLMYGPQLDIYEKKNNSVALEMKEKQLIQSISKLKIQEYDKGIQLFESGNPIDTISYYEKAEQTGENLSFEQKTVMIDSLRSVGDIEKMEYYLKQSLMAEESALNQSSLNFGESEQKDLMLSQKSGTTTVESISDSIHILQLYQSTGYVEEADEYASAAVQSAIDKAQSLEIPSQEVILLEVKSYIQVANIKLSINETSESIKQTIKGLQILDELPYVHLCERTYDLGNTLKKMKSLSYNREDLPHLQKIMHSSEYNKIFSEDIEDIKKKILLRIDKIRNEEELESEILKSSKQYSERSMEEPKSEAKMFHEAASSVMEKYFKRKDKKNKLRDFDLGFALASWEIEKTKIQSEGLDEEEEINLREELKSITEQFIFVRRDYKEYLQAEKDIYDILYRNIYKTSLNVEPCLRSYKNNFFVRYASVYDQQEKFEGESIEVARALWKQGEIMQEFGNIIEKDKKTGTNYLSDSEMQGTEKIHAAKEMIKRIEEFQISNSNQSLLNTSFYTTQKTQIESSLMKFYKGRVLEKEETIRSSLRRSHSLNQSTNSLSSSQKSFIFGELVRTMEKRMEIFEDDKRINSSISKVKSSCEKIEILNESGCIDIPNQSYNDRLKSCFPEFQLIMKVVEQCKEKGYLERNGNIAQIYLLMAENQFKLGLIMNASEFLKRSHQSLNKSLKIEDESSEMKVSRKKNNKIDRDKLLYGNKTKIGIVRLQSHMVAFFGGKKDKTKLINDLLHVDHILSEKMNEPLNEAEIKECIGLLYANMATRYREIDYDEVVEPIFGSIEIRERLLGRINKMNARLYTILMEMTVLPENGDTLKKQTEKFYKKGHEIFNKIDFQADPMLFLYSMQLETTYLITMGKSDEACFRFEKSLNNYDQHINKQFSLEVCKEYFRAGKFMMGIKSFRKNGLKWLEKSYEEVKRLEKYIEKHYSVQFVKEYHLLKNDKESVKVSEMKKKILDAMIAFETKYGKKERKMELEKELQKLKESQKKDEKEKAEIEFQEI